MLRRNDELAAATFVRAEDGRLLHYERGAPVVGGRMNIECFDPANNRGPLERNRFLGHFERLDVPELIGELPPLLARRTRRLRIRDVMLASTELPVAVTKATDSARCAPDQWILLAQPRRAT